MNNFRSAFFQLLSAEQQGRLIEIASLVHYSDKQLVHCRGDDKPGLSVIKSGSVNVGVGGADGTFVLTTILGPGECFGEFTLFTELPRTHDIYSAGSTSIYQIPAAPFMRVFSSDADYAKALLKTTLMRTHQMLELFDTFQRLPLMERTAKILLSMSLSSGDFHEVKCRQSDLAITLGTTRVSLGKVLQNLSHEGLIELGYGKILLPDRQHLQAWLEQRCDITPV